MMEGAVQTDHHMTVILRVSIIELMFSILPEVM